MIRFGWETFKKRPWVLIGGFLIVTIVSSVVLNIIEQMFPSTSADTSFIGFLFGVPVQTLASIGMVSFALKAHDAIEAVEFSDLWRPQYFLYYLCMIALYFAAAIVGFVLLIIPGIIAVLMFYFAGYFVVDRSLGPIEAMKESARITKGHRWQLLGLFGLAALLNIAGALALLVGLLVTIPVTFLAAAHAYRTLSRAA